MKSFLIALGACVVMILKLRNGGNMMCAVFVNLLGLHLAEWRCRPTLHLEDDRATVDVNIAGFATPAIELVARIPVVHLA